ncbi:hypothetical protein Cni_G03156 [Canna indica]|uniref:Uncharacterized protein n=1 Tax=Canna indica TaxID=4628 RepID=A0AAQ3JT22_9LILI|nr:hypothetical protein Cni_G03156 [Canna indica]
MLELPIFYQMAIICSCNHNKLAIAICLFFLFVYWSCCCCCSNHLASTFVAFFVVGLSTSAPFLLARIKYLVKDEAFADNSNKSVTEAATEEEEEDVVAEEKSSRSTSQCSNFDDESSPEDEAYRSTESSEDSISDDENLIEISLPDGHFVASEEPKALLKPLLPDLRRGFPTNILPDSVMRQHGLTELLSEINEEDNLIEIDIVRGSIKCSRVAIKA